MNVRKLHSSGLIEKKWWLERYPNLTKKAKSGSRKWFRMSGTNSKRSITIFELKISSGKKLRMNIYILFLT